MSFFCVKGIKEGCPSIAVAVAALCLAAEGAFGHVVAPSLWQDREAYVLSRLKGTPSEHDLYRAARDETYPRRTMTRLEVCARGYRVDTEVAGFKMEPHLLWIYTPASLALRALAAREEDPCAAAKYRAGLDLSAEAARPFMEAAKTYPNTAERPFKYANWREGWNWRPQRTQKEAEAVAADGNQEVLGTRKELERCTMTAPLSAAVICACAGKTVGEIAETIARYDYSTPSLCEFFLAPLAAELAWDSP